jgi:hypothetical protein
MAFARVRLEQGRGWERGGACGHARHATMQA